MKQSQVDMLILLPYTQGYLFIREATTIYQEAIKVCNARMIEKIPELYGLEGYRFFLLDSDGGCNVVYRCDREGFESRIVRFSFLGNRSKEDLLGETEFVQYLFLNGASVANVLPSVHGRLVEELRDENQTYYVCLFAFAKGKRMVDNQYRYLDGVPIREYFYSCGKTIGHIHRLAKAFSPLHPRKHFTEIYNPDYLDRILPGSRPLLKQKANALIKRLEELPRTNPTYGMVHLDYCDGNYHVDFDNGQITVYDFDNSCFCWYLYDLADLWHNGTGWIAYDPDIQNRKKFMKDYFHTALEGYRSETDLEESALALLPLLIRATYLESIVDAFESKKRVEQEEDDQEKLAEIIRMLENDIDYFGFFEEGCCRS